MQKWHQCAVRLATLVTVTHASLIRHGIAPAEKTIVIDHGVDTSLFFPTPSHIRRKYHLQKKFVILYSGSFAPWHSCDRIILAAQLLREQKDIVFILVGKGDMFERCRMLVKQFGLERSVIFSGPVPYRAMPAYINAADVCLALFDRTYPPFLKYSFFYSPMKINEYRASGKPVIASNFGKLTTLITHGRHGLLVNEQHPQDVASSIIKLFHNPSLCKKIGNNNLKDIQQHYLWDLINRRILRELQQRTSSF